MGHCHLSWLSCLTLLAACATASPDVAVSSNALYRGDPAAPPAFAVLPDVTKPQQTTRVAQGLSLARHVLGTALPTAPDDRRYASLQAWIDETVAPWISARRDSVDETRFQFGLGDNAARPDKIKPAEAEQVIARAVLGLMQENTAQELSQMPMPEELDSEPEIAEIYRDLVSTQSKPFRNAALAEYEQCSALADDAGRELQRWAEFCHVRSVHLRQTPVPVGSSGSNVPATATTKASTSVTSR